MQPPPVPPFTRVCRPPNPPHTSAHTFREPFLVSESKDMDAASRIINKKKGSLRPPIPPSRPPITPTKPTRQTRARFGGMALYAVCQCTKRSHERPVFFQQGGVAAILSLARPRLGREGGESTRARVLPLSWSFWWWWCMCKQWPVH